MNRKFLLGGTLGAVVLAFIIGAVLVSSNSSQPSSGLVKEYTPILGPKDAPVTIVEFLDPECESCAAFYPAVKNLLSLYPNEVRLAVRYMLYHGNSLLAALATEAAGRQGKYWEMQSILFERADIWSHRRNPQNLAFEAFAEEVGLDLRLFRQDMNDSHLRARIIRDFEEGKAIGVKGTPTFFVNGKQLVRLSYYDLRQMIEAELRRIEDV